MLLAADPWPRFAGCVQCGRCSSGCPVAFESWHTPRKVLRLLQLGETEEACQSPFLWLCAMCQTCLVRCPEGIEVPEIMLALRRLAQDKRWIKPQPFYRTFQKMVLQKKKINELHLGITKAVRKFPLHPLEEAILLWKLWRRGKVR